MAGRTITMAIETKMEAMTKHLDGPTDEPSAAIPPQLHRLNLPQRRFTKTSMGGERLDGINIGFRKAFNIATELNTVHPGSALVVHSSTSVYLQDADRMTALDAALSTNPMDMARQSGASQRYLASPLYFF